MMERESYLPSPEEKGNLFEGIFTVPDLRRLIRERKMTFTNSSGDLFGTEEIIGLIDKAVEGVRHERNSKSWRYQDLKLNPEQIERMLASSGITRDKGLRSALVRILSQDTDVTSVEEYRR